MQETVPGQIRQVEVIQLLGDEKNFNTGRIAAPVLFIHGCCCYTAQSLVGYAVFHK